MHELLRRKQKPALLLRKKPAPAITPNSAATDYSLALYDSGALQIQQRTSADIRKAQYH